MKFPSSFLNFASLLTPILHVNATSYLNFTVTAAANGSSILECWQLTTPFAVSTQPGNVSNASYSIIPGGTNDGYHTPQSQRPYPFHHSAHEPSKPLQSTPLHTQLLRKTPDPPLRLRKRQHTQAKLISHHLRRRKRRLDRRRYSGREFAGTYLRFFGGVDFCCRSLLRRARCRLMRCCIGRLVRVRSCGMGS